MATIVVRNMTTGEDCTLVGVGTIGDVKYKLERAMNVPSESQILVARNGQTLLLHNAMVLNVQPNTIMQIYTKASPQPVDIEIIHMDTLSTYELTVPSDQTVAYLRGKIDKLLGISLYRRYLTTLQAIMSDDDAQLSEYLLVPLPAEVKQVIMVNEEKRPP